MTVQPLGETQARARRSTNRKELTCKLSVQVYNGKEMFFLEILKSASLEGRLVEICFPALKGRPDFIKVVVVPLIPYVPCHNDCDFYEELVGGVFFGGFHHCEEVLLAVPIELKMLPTFLAERTCKEKMECCFLYDF
jgi:hypothetical protein